MENECKRTISARLRYLRINQDLSQETVREITGIEVSKYETSKKIPKIETLTSLADFYGVHISYFFPPGPSQT